MHIDIVIDFYRKGAHWPKVAFGLAQNIDHINRVIVVNDEPWTDEGRLLFWRDPIHLDPTKLLLLDHEHEGFGSARCVNEGMRAVETEYWMVLNADVMLGPDSLADTLALAAPRTIIYPFVDDIPVHFEDGFSSPFTGAPWRYYRDFCALEHTASSLVLGGRREFPSWGYSDHDYGCRWALHFGLDKVLHDGGTVYNLGANDARHVVSPETLALWYETKDKFQARYGSAG